MSDLIGIRPGVNTLWEDGSLVGLAHGGAHVASLGIYDGVRVRE